MLACMDLAVDKGVPYHTHVLETKTQAVTGPEFYGRSLVAYMHDLGLLKRNTTFAHSVWVSDEDMALMGEAGMSIAHNAVSNQKLGAGIAPIRRLLDGVGYVGAANFDVMRGKDGVDRILEINLRQGATSYYAMAAGGNLSRCFVDDLVYGRDLSLEVTTDERLWLNVPYPAVLAFGPKGLRPLVRAAARRGTVHTLRYAPDRSLVRRLDVARLDLRHTLDYVQYRGTRLNR